MNELNIVNEWLQISYEDYDTAKYLYDTKQKKPFEIICYHCQQSAEKSLKAYICANGVDVLKNA
jgi:HEPN domain-containing protein